MSAAKVRSAASSIAALPPFPSDINTAPLFRVSLDKILAKDVDESARVLEACKTRGFFYLNLDTDEGEELERESEALLDLSRQVFDLPLEEKKEYMMEMGGPLAGYKAVGTIAAIDPNKRPDTTEFFNISKDHVQCISKSRAYPPIIASNTELFKSFTTRAHTIGLTVLECLATQLNLPAKTFADFNNFNMTAGDHVRLTKKIPHPTDSNHIGLVAHTDFGSITILFNWLGGLQIKSKSPHNLGEWEYVKPLAGYAICNLGDAMVKFTSGELKSAKHRVVPAPGEQATVDRYSVVYFMRPADETKLKAVYGSEVGKGTDAFTAKEWIARRVIELQGGKK